MDFKKGVIILPSTLTSFSLILGFLAVISCFSETMLTNFPFTVLSGCWMVIFACFLDGLDGKVARLTKTTSSFGIEYDSMADLVTFGVAPAVIMYRTFLMELDPVFLIFPVLFLLASAIRLSRFNTTASEKGKKFNVGLPMPASGGMLCTTILFINYLKANGYLTGTEKQILPAFLGLIILCCCQMVSTVRYDNGGTFWFRNIPIAWIKYTVIAFFIGLLVFVDPVVFFFGIAAYYIAFSSIRHLYYRSQSGRLADLNALEKLEGEKEKL
jgi:CDP-diacylglycerol--serine O-phosphatidyltransferase